MRTLAAVVVVGLLLAGLAGAAVRGVRRFRPADVEEAGRTTARAVVEGLIVLAAVILGVVIVYAIVA